MVHRRNIVAPAVALLLLSCSDATVVRAPTRLDIVTAPPATVVNRVVFPVQPVVRLEDDEGNAIARSGITVTVSVSAGGGSLLGTSSATTNESGVATFTGLAIGGVAGGRALTFSAPGLASATVTVTTTGGAPSAVAMHTGDAQTEGEAIPVPVRPAVRVTDVDGNGSPGAAVAFAATSGGGTVTGATQGTDADGVAAVGSWTLGAAGANALTASVAGLTDVVVFTATALRLPVATVAVTAPAGNLLPGSNRQLVATARDSVGRSLTNRAFTWSSGTPDVASVSDAGLVTGVLPGTSAVTASSEGKSGSATVSVVAPTLVREFSLTGHIGATVNNGQGPPAGFEYGFGYYSSVHALNTVHAQSTQLGWGSWMLPNNLAFNEPLCPVGTTARDFWPERGPSYRDVYQTIEGGMGEWGSTRFPSAMTKFRVNGTPDCYNTQIASHGWTFNGTLLPPNKIGLAQLSNRIVVPPDGFTFSGGASLIGNAWIALPLIPASTAPSGLSVGDQSWTLFLKASNFSGPVAFYTPETWTLVHLDDASGRGRGHDVRPMYGGGVAIELGTLPYFTGQDTTGERYRRVPRLTFPVDGQGRSVLQQDARFYSKQAIWDGFATWMGGGAAPSTFNAAGISTPAVSGSQVGVRMAGVDVQYPAAFSGGALATAGAQSAFGFQWTGPFEAGVFPEYYRESAGGGTWTAVPASEVPRRTWLVDQQFTPQPRTTFPNLDVSASAPFTSARWAAGPFTTTLNDGSRVDYVWYKFVEQPAITRLGLSTAQLAALQSFVETFHETAGVMGVSMAPPTSGTLATLDAGLLVTPPTGLEKGYVPVVIRQY